MKKTRSSCIEDATITRNLFVTAKKQQASLTELRQLRSATPLQGTPSTTEP